MNKIYYICQLISVRSLSINKCVIARSGATKQSHYQQDMRLRLLVLLRKNVRNDGLYEQTLISFMKKVFFYPISTIFF